MTYVVTQASRSRLKLQKSRFDPVRCSFTVTRVTERRAVNLLQRLTRIYLGPNADYQPAAMRNIPG